MGRRFSSPPEISFSKVRATVVSSVPEMATAADRLFDNSFVASKAKLGETLGASRPRYVSNVHPRVERSAQMSLYTRGQFDLRPASIAHPDGESQWLSAALGATVTRSMFESMDTFGSAIGGDVPQPDRYIAMGDKKNEFEIERVGDNDYTFTPRVRGKARGKTLQPPVGTVLDVDKVPEAVIKLHGIFPTEVPLMVSRGDAVAHGVAPARHIRTCFESRGVRLVETEAIGVQCLRVTYSKFCKPRAERVSRVNLAARARTDGPLTKTTGPRARPDSIAWLRPVEYSERSTFKGTIG